MKKKQERTQDEGESQNPNWAAIPPTIRRDVLKNPITYIEQSANLVSVTVELIVKGLVLLASTQTFMLMLAVYIYPEAANRSLADLTLGDLYGHLLSSITLLYILIGLGLCIVVLGARQFGYRNLFRERMEAEFKKWRLNGDPIQLDQQG